MLVTIPLPLGTFTGRQAALIVSMDQLIGEFGLPCPNYIKIDTPGMSEAIITGGLTTLERPEVREIHIELRERSKGGQRIAHMLEGHGFVVTGRYHHGGSCDVTFARPAT